MTKHRLIGPINVLQIFENLQIALVDNAKMLLYVSETIFSDLDRTLQQNALER